MLNNYSPFTRRSVERETPIDVPLWSFSHDGHTWDAVVRSAGDARGFEARVSKDGMLRHSCSLATRDAALRWAGQTRQLIERDAE